LAAEFYEPHQDEKMLGTMAYQLKFPLHSTNHPIFHRHVVELGLTLLNHTSALTVLGLCLCHSNISP